MKVLSVFDPAQVPTETIADFLHWYDLATEFYDDRDYESTEGTAAPVVKWWEVMHAKYPPKMDGPEGTTRYIIGSAFVYFRVAEDDAAQALIDAREQAGVQGLGLYIASSGDVELPGGVTLA